MNSLVKQQSKIPLLRSTNGEVLSGNPFSTVVLSSASATWNHLVVEEHRFTKHELDDLMYIQHVVAVNLGRPIDCEYRNAGHFQPMTKGTGTIYLSPSHKPFHVSRSPKTDANGSADVLYVALDSVFVSQIGEGLEIYPDRLELVEQQRSADPALLHIALALRCGVQASHSRDALYGESLGTALAVHLLREYGAIAVRPRVPCRGLSRPALGRAIEYVRDQLHRQLTVSEIATAVHMSPHHFTLLFKQSTGQSPYSYVIEARTKRARELLASGEFSISEIAHRVGFADQSHLSRHIKRMFGITPKMLLAKTYQEPNSSKETDESPRPLSTRSTILE